MALTTRDLYYWHYNTLRDLRRISDECGMRGYNVEGLAGNAGQHTTTLDMKRQLNTLLLLGMVEKIPPQFEFDSAYPWYGITTKGREFVRELSKKG